MQNNPELHRQTVQRFLDSKAVDFAAVGRVVAELGPSVSLMEEPVDFFCGTMRTFFFLYKLPVPYFPTGGPQVEELRDLRETVGEL